MRIPAGSAVSAVGVYNRRDNQVWLGQFEILVGDQPGGGGARARRCGGEQLSVHHGDALPRVVYCDEVLTGAYVTVRQLGEARYLSVAEVFVYGPSVDGGRCDVARSHEESAAAMATSLTEPVMAAEAAAAETRHTTAEGLCDELNQRWSPDRTHGAPPHRAPSPRCTADSVHHVFVWRRWSLRWSRDDNEYAKAGVLMHVYDLEGAMASPDPDPDPMDGNTTAASMAASHSWSWSPDPTREIADRLSASVVSVSHPLPFSWHPAARKNLIMKLGWRDRRNPGVVLSTGYEVRRRVRCLYAKDTATLFFNCYNWSAGTRFEQPGGELGKCTPGCPKDRFLTGANDTGADMHWSKRNRAAPSWCGEDPPWCGDGLSPPWKPWKCAWRPSQMAQMLEQEDSWTTPFLPQGPWSAQARGDLQGHTWCTRLPRRAPSTRCAADLVRHVWHRGPRL